MPISADYLARLEYGQDREVPRAPEPGDTLAVPCDPTLRQITKLAVVHHTKPSPRYIVQTDDGTAWLCFERRTPSAPLPPQAHQYLALERLPSAD